ncbi:MAG: hypothetical protein QXW97_02730 [Candidatus Pacearchaeota archaeon]
MEKGEIKHIERIIFLIKFTEEIIKNLSKRHDIERKIRIEKLKRKFGLKPSIANSEINESFKEVLNSRILEPPQYPKILEYLYDNEPTTVKNENLEIIKPKKPLLKNPPPKQIPKILQKKESIFHKDSGIQEIKKEDILKKTKILESIKPEYSQKPENFSLGKIDEILKDPFIQAVESPGPEKNVLVKKNNRINVTKIILSQEEINNIIKIFSEYSKIPIIGGILKAAVGDLVISAVISEQAGSRFVLKKISPSLIS